MKFKQNGLRIYYYDGAYDKFKRYCKKRTVFYYYRRNSM